MRHLVRLFTLFMLLAVVGCTAQKRNPVVYMIGDSTMANKGGLPKNKERGWGQMLPLFVDSTLVIVNKATNGRSTKSFRDEGRWQPIMDSMKQGDYVIIQFGHNDEKSEQPKLYADSEVDFPNNLKRYITETREKGGIPILCTSIPRRHFDENGQLIDTHGNYVTVVFKVAEEMDVPLIDMNKSVTALIKSVPEEDSKMFFMWYPPSKQDNTHLNVLGGKIVAKLAIDEIAEKVPALKRYTVKDSENIREVAPYIEGAKNYMKNE